MNDKCKQWQFKSNHQNLNVNSKINDALLCDRESQNPGWIFTTDNFNKVYPTF